MGEPVNVARRFIAASTASGDLPAVAASLRATPGVQDVKERDDLGLLVVTFAPELGTEKIGAIQAQLQGQFPGLSFEPDAELRPFRID